jgi:hypothetical protein
MPVKFAIHLLEKFVSSSRLTIMIYFDGRAMDRPNAQGGWCREDSLAYDLYRIAPYEHK